MDFKTACAFIIKQTITDGSEPDASLARLQQFQPPIPGQVTSLLLALKVVNEGLKPATTLDRPLASALHQLAYESRRQFERGRHAGIDWPPLLDEDLDRIAQAVTQIFNGPAV
jgi:hypothetical protein